MKKIIPFLERYSASVLRISMALVMLWFSLQQLMNAPAWTAYVPDSAVAITHVSAVSLVYFNGIFELIFGIMLLFGVYTRVAALLLGLHLLDIMYVVGYGEIGVRDFGLAFGTLAVFMHGPDVLCFQRRKQPINSEPAHSEQIAAERPRKML